MAKSNQTGSFHSIQFLRFAAALLVVIFHTHMAQVRLAPVAPSAEATYYLSAGTVGVHIFFVVSGFVMAHTSLEKFAVPGAWAEFLLRRFCRIFPPYWVYAFLYIALHASSGSPYSLSAGEMFEAALLLPGGSASIIGPGWTLSYELFFYFCFGLSLLFTRWLGLIALTAAFLLAITYGLANGATANIPFNPLLLEFLAGVWTAVYINKVSPPRAASCWLAIVSALLMFAAVITYGYDRLPSVIVWGIPSATIVFGLVQLERNRALPAIVSRLSFLGDSSYSLYLLHILIIHFSITSSTRFGQTTGNHLLDLILVTILCVAAGHLAHRSVELPVTRLARRMMTMAKNMAPVTRTA